MLRYPAVAGSFYPSEPEALRQEIHRHVQPLTERLPAVGCVAPHAGYMYSGSVAGAVFGAMELPPVFVVLGPNHTGRGAAMSLWPGGDWQTPLGRARMDAGLAAGLKREYPALRDDDAAHEDEHSIEVEIPFLQHLVPQFTFVPVVMAVSDVERLEEFGQALAQAVRTDGRRILIVASSDMNHYEPDGLTREKDRRAIEAMLRLDARALRDVLRRDGNTMCGWGPVVAMLTAARQLGATRATLIRYATSGDVERGRRDWVVGYAGIVVQ